MTQTECLFCNIVQGQIPVNKVTETDQCIVFNDIQPQAPTHLLVIHKKHSDCLATTEDSILLDLMQAAKAATTKLKLDDFRLVVNNGKEAGQTIFHTHIHILAGRALAWPPG